MNWGAAFVVLGLVALASTIGWPGWVALAVGVYIFRRLG